MDKLQFAELRMRGRRGRSRLKTCVTANVMSLFGSLAAELQDISLTGAHLKITNPRMVSEPIKPGHSLLVCWGAFEAMGKVVWVEGESLGVEFDEIVTPATLIATRDMSDELAKDGGAQSHLRRQVREWVGVR